MRALVRPPTRRSDPTAQLRRPTLDLTRVVTTGELVLGAVLVARQFARRPTAPKAHVTMGPGGWVSLKGGSVAIRPVRRPWNRPDSLPAGPAPKTPFWARLLSAVPVHRFPR